MSPFNPRSVCVYLVLVAIAVALPSVMAGDFKGEANFFVGWKALDEDDWGIYHNDGTGPLYSLDNHAAFGAELTWGSTSWPVSIASDVFWSAETAGSGFDDTYAWTMEIDPGVRKVWELGRIRPYVGGGLGLIFGGINLDCAPEGPIQCQFEGDSGNDKEVTVGAWLNAGVFFRLGGKFNIGASTRWSTGGDLQIHDVDRNPGGFQLGLLLGFGWPKYEK
jgi:hypothetical protein